VLNGGTVRDIVCVCAFARERCQVTELAGRLCSHMMLGGEVGW
jgi:hypothetical protein